MCAFWKKMKKTNIIFDAEHIRLSRRRIRHIVKKVTVFESVRPKGCLSLVFVSDETIRRINKEYLGKDTPTDVIAFSYDDEDVWGEIYISIDRAAEQANQYSVSYNEELTRLIIHGMLHLAGYEDTHPERKKIMFERQEMLVKKIMNKKIKIF